MMKKEKIFPIDTIGGRIYNLRNNLGFNSPSGRIDFYNFLFSEDKDIYDDSKNKNVYNWECSEYSIPIPVLKRICEKCNCSSDYLLGIEKEVNHDVHFICNYTGLSEDAVDILTKNNNSYFPIVVNAINFLLERDDYIDNKLELLHLILNYVLLSQNIKSYDECDVPCMEKRDISLRDEYGTAIGCVSIERMANVFLLSINELLSKLKNNISTKKLRKIPSIYKILNDMLFDLIRMEDIRNKINRFNFDIDELSRMNRRLKENTKRLIFLYGIQDVSSIDFNEFKSSYPQYDDKHIELLKVNLNF